MARRIKATPERSGYYSVGYFSGYWHNIGMGFDRAVADPLTTEAEVADTVSTGGVSMALSPGSINQAFVTVPDDPPDATV